MRICAGKRLEESKKINQSLSALGNVIAALTDHKGTRAHIPYRFVSLLTRPYYTNLQQQLLIFRAFGFCKVFRQELSLSQQ